MRRRREKKKFTFGILSIIFALIYLPISLIIILNILLCFIALLALIFSIISLTKEDFKFLGFIGLLLTILGISIVISFYFFGPKTRKTATINGKKYSYNEIEEIAESNKVTFDEEYEGKNIKLEGTISSIEEEYGKYVNIYKVNFQEGWILELPMNCNYNLKKYKNGDKIKVKSKISHYITDIYLSDYSIDTKNKKVECRTTISKK